MKQVTPLTQLKFSIISCSYMYQSDEDIIRLTLEHLKGYKNCKMLETGFHVYKLSFVFPKQFKMKIKKKPGESNMSAWSPGPPGYSVFLRYALDRPCAVLSSHTVYGSDIRPVRPTFFLHRSLWRTPGAVVILFQFKY